MPNFRSLKLSFSDIKVVKSQSPTALLSALRRVGKRLPIVHDVEGFFTPNGEPLTGSRLFGTLETRDALVYVGFDRAKVALPVGPGVIRVSGKLWLGERTSGVTLMVNQYTVIGSQLDVLCIGSTQAIAASTEVECAP